MDENKVSANIINPGPIVLMGSGETSPSSGAVFEEVARLYTDHLRVAILETPAGFELNSNRVAGRVGDYLENRLQNYHPKIEVIPARKKGTKFSPDNEEILEPLYRVDMIFMGPGSPTFTARQLSGSLAYEIIQARQRTGAALVLASAATIAFGCQTMPVYEIYKAGMDIHWQEGLDFFQQYGLSLIIVPHWNNTEGGAELDTSRCFMGAKRFTALRNILDCRGTILGIDEHTSVWIDLNERKARIFGKGYIHLLKKTDEESFQSGTEISLDKMGEFLPLDDWKTGLRDSVVCSVLDASRLVQVEVTEQPSAELLDWMNQRDAARKSGNFQLADQIRMKIEQSGWRIADTPDGSVIEKM
jgi:hypothetical protein